MAKKWGGLTRDMANNAEKHRCEGKAESIERLSEAVICRGISPIRKRDGNVAALKLVGLPLFSWMLSSLGKHENFLVFLAVVV